MSAQKEQENYQKGIEYSIERTKALGQELAHDFLNTEAVKELVELFNSFLEILDKLIQHPALTGAGLAVGGGIFALIHNFSQITDSLNKMQTAGRAMIQVDKWVGELGGTAGQVSLALEQMGMATSQLPIEQAAAILASKGLSEGQIKLALAVYNARDAELQKAIADGTLNLSELTAAGGTKVLTIDMEALTASIWANIKAIGVWLVTNPVGWLVLAAGAVVGLVATVDALTESIEEAHDKYSDAVSDLDSTQEDIKNIETELQDIRDRIVEINESGPLSFTDEQELSNLKTQEALLKQQLETKKELKKYKEDSVRSAASNYLEATDPWENFEVVGGINGTGFAYTGNAQDVLDKTISQARGLVDLKQQQIDKQNELDSLEAQGLKNTREYKTLEKELNDLSDAITVNSDSLSESYDNISEAISHAYDEDGAIIAGWEERVARYQELVSIINGVANKQGYDARLIGLVDKNVNDSNKSNLENLDYLLNEARPQNEYEEIQYQILKDYTKAFTDEEWNAWDVATRGAKDGTEAIRLYEEACLKAIASLEGVETAAENAFSVATITDAVDDIDKQLKPQFDELGEAWKAIFEDDETTIDLSVVDNDLKQGISDAFMNIAEDIGVNFEDASEEVNKFLKVISDQSSNVNQVQDAFDDLATAYFYSAEGLKNVNSETAESIKQSLKKLGVVNAEVLVEQALADAELEEKVATELATGAKIGEIQQLLNEASASDTARVAAFQLAAQEKILNNQKLSFSEKISSLKQYASALLETADAARMQSHIDQIAQQTMYGVSQEDINNKINSYVANYTPLSLKPVEVEFNPIKYNPDAGGSSSGGSGGGSGSDSTKEADKFYQVLDWIERKLAAVQKQIDKFGKIASGTWRTWAQRARAINKEIERTKRLIDVNKTAAKEYEKAANNVVKTSKGKGVYVDKDGNKHNLNAGDRYYKDDNGDKRKLTDKQVKKLEDLQKKYKTGLLGPGDISSISNEKVYNAFTQWQEWYDKQLDAESAWYDARDQLAQEYMERFQLTETKYENILSKYEHQANMLAKRVEGFEINGLLASHSNLNKEAEIVENQLRNTNKEIDALLKKRADAVNEGNIEKGSEEWYEMTKAIWSAKEQAKDYENTLDEIAKKHRELDWERFDLLQQKISRVSSEAQFLGELLSSKKLVNSIDQYTTTQLDNDKNLFKGIGNLTKEGMAALGMYGVQYEVAARQMDNLRDEYAKLQKQLKERPYDQNIINRLEELQDEMQSTGKTIQDVENSIIELRRQQIEADIAGMTKLVDLYQTALDEQKSLSDYQKNVSDQSRNISTLQKQIVAYQGDTSEENRARLQKLNKELIDAQKNLEETETEHLISEQKKMLDNLVAEYSEILTLTLNNPEAIVKEMMADMNTNQRDIKNTIEDVADDVGYQVSNQMETILQSEQIASLYKSHDYTSSISGVATTLGSIEKKVDEWIKYSETTSGTGSTDGSNYDSSQGTDSSIMDEATRIRMEKQMISQQINKKQQEIDRLRAENTELEKKWWSTNDAGKRASYQKKYDENALKGIKLQSEIDELQRKYNSCAVGAHNLPKDEIAWTQEEGDEVVIRKRDGAILTPLKRGDSVLTAAQTENLYNLAKIPTNELKMALRGAGGNTNVTSLNNNSLDIGDVSFNITLPNVSNYKDFKEQMKNDKSMETYLRSVTTDRLFKGSALKKYNT